MRTFFVFLLGALGSGQVFAQPADDSAAENQCILCHANPDVWEKETLHLFVKPQDLAEDVHWQKGIKCQECHGGNPETTNLREAHAGMALLAKFREAGVAVPAIFFTARINPADLERYRAAGAIGTLSKPFDPLKLGRQIAQIWAENFPPAEDAP